MWHSEISLSSIFIAKQQHFCFNLYPIVVQEFTFKLILKYLKTNSNWRMQSCVIWNSLSDPLKSILHKSEPILFKHKKSHPNCAMSGTSASRQSALFTSACAWHASGTHRSVYYPVKLCGFSHTSRAQKESMGSIGIWTQFPRERIGNIIQDGVSRESSPAAKRTGTGCERSGWRVVVILP